MSNPECEKLITESNRQQQPSEEEIAQKAKSLEFDVHKSIRYLTKRRGFFDTLHHIATVLTAISGSVAFGVLFTDHQVFAQVLTGVVVLISAVDFSIGFSKKSKLYDSLQSRFSDLLITMTCESSTMENIKKWKAERFLIEKDEPPTLKVLEVICHNEQCIADGYNDHVHKVHWFKALLRHFWSFDNWNPKK